MKLSESLMLRLSKESKVMSNLFLAKREIESPRLKSCRFEMQALEMNREL
jgi:hypothetical protein